MSDPVRVEVTDRAGPETPVRVTSIPWWRAIAVRAARTWIQGFLGFLGASFVPTTVPADATGLVLAPYAGALLVAAQLALIPALVSVLMNAAELLAKLDATNPELRA